MAVPLVIKAIQLLASNRKDRFRGQLRKAVLLCSYRGTGFWAIASLDFIIDIDGVLTRLAPNR
jgi:hypothetical protein